MMRAEDDSSTLRAPWVTIPSFHGPTVSFRIRSSRVSIVFLACHIELLFRFPMTSRMLSFTVV